MRTVLKCILGLLMVALGCAGIVSAKGHSPPPGYTGPIAQRPEWKVGDSWTFQGKRGWKLEESFQLKWTVLELKPNEILVKEEGAPGKFTRHYTPDLNWFKNTPETQRVSRVEPDVQWFRWPLWVGKTWSGVRTDYPSGKKYTQHAKVEALEKVELTSGQEIEAFRISYQTEDPVARDPKQQRGYGTWAVWYAPSIKNVVRVEIDSAALGKTRQELTDYKPAAATR